jgi:hypothetical protein
MDGIEKQTPPISSFKSYIGNKGPCCYDIPHGLTYWDLIGRWFSGESKLDILVDGDKIQGGIVIQIDRENFKDGHNTNFFIECQDDLSEETYFVRIHKVSKPKGVFLTYLGAPWDNAEEHEFWTDEQWLASDD